MADNLNNVRVRFAPSPTGHLHIGSVRTALFNYLFAKKSNGRFIIRIEDTDLERNIKDAETKLLDGLKWVGIDWDESIDKEGEYGPYRSMDRLHLYQPFIDQLLKEKKAYHCYCTVEELEEERKQAIEKGETPKYSGKCRYLTKEQKEEYERAGRKPSIRFHVPADELIEINDHIKGKVTFQTNDIGDFVIIRPNGVPTYNFAVTIDDYLMKITHVIRGDEHLANTPRQVLLYQALNLPVPEFAHLPLILNQERQKMSKRDESIIQFVEQYQALGFLPEALLNFVGLLGWSPEGEEEILTKTELIKQFSLERVNKSPAVFDTDKLFWMNNYYIKQLPLEELVKMSIPYLSTLGLTEKLNKEELAWITVLVKIYQEQLRYVAEVQEFAKFYLQDSFSYDEESLAILREPHVPIVLAEFAQQIKDLEEFTPETIKQALKNTQVSTGYKGKQLYMSIRVAVTGQLHGRDLPETLYLITKEKVLKQLELGIKILT